MSFTHNLGKMFVHRIADRPTIHLEHSVLGIGGGFATLTPITATRPATGTARTTTGCSECGAAVLIEISDAASARRKVALLRTVTAVVTVLFLGFLTYMIVGSFLGPVEDRPSELLWLVVYLPLLAAFFGVTSAFGAADGVRVIDDEFHALGTPETLLSSRQLHIAAAVLLPVGLLVTAAGVALVANTEGTVGLGIVAVIATGAALILGAGYSMLLDWNRTPAADAAVPPQRGRDALIPITLSAAECGSGVLLPVTVDTGVTCTACGGAGRDANTMPCPRCAGDGRVRERRTIQARIPAGVTAGQRIRLIGQGEQGRGGGPCGDLYLQIVLAGFR